MLGTFYTFGSPAAALAVEAVETHSQIFPLFFQGRSPFPGPGSPYVETPPLEQKKERLAVSNVVILQACLGSAKRLELP